MSTSVQLSELQSVDQDINVVVMNSRWEAESCPLEEWTLLFTLPGVHEASWEFSRLHVLFG